MFTSPLLVSTGSGRAPVAPTRLWANAPTYLAFRTKYNTSQVTDANLSGHPAGLLPDNHATLELAPSIWAASLPVEWWHVTLQTDVSPQAGRQQVSCSKYGRQPAPRKPKAGVSPQTSPRGQTASQRPPTGCVLRTVTRWKPVPHPQGWRSCGGRVGPDPHGP